MCIWVVQYDATGVQIEEMGLHFGRVSLGSSRGRGEVVEFRGVHTHRHVASKPRAVWKVTKWKFRCFEMLGCLN